METSFAYPNYSAAMNAACTCAAGADRARELLIPRRAGVAYDDALVLEVAGRPRPGAHAHVARRPADHDFLDPVPVQHGI
ncbi:unnamed protein product [Gemmata massiliana]|uniref:Uncharacterized protein n=1 Tax=Gemmata massiliana TaxID=1210884 RepID=A0A6P2DG81_9BACT|nr:hypothetical protein [Gemmata massiliana]VTS00722.1 unnamed protein product [Gemmata massiliana]